MGKGVGCIRVSHVGLTSFKTPAQVAGRRFLYRQKYTNRILQPIVRLTTGARTLAYLCSAAEDSYPTRRDLMESSRRTLAEVFHFPSQSFGMGLDKRTNSSRTYGTQAVLLQDQNGHLLELLSNQGLNACWLQSFSGS